MHHQKCKCKICSLHKPMILAAMESGVKYYDSEHKPTQKQAWICTISIIVNEVFKKHGEELINLEEPKSLIPSLCQFRRFLKKARSERPRLRSLMSKGCID